MPDIATHIRTQLAIQGVQGSFHEIAAQQYFGEGIGLQMCESFPRLFQSMKSGAATFGVVAIENTVAGTLLPNYALLRDSGFRIIGEVFLRIEHQLLALPGQQLTGLREVYSHPMALLQCARFLDLHPHLKAIESHDTAESARWIMENQTKGAAAIASRRAGELFGLEAIAENVEDNHRNFTRFLVICDPQHAPALSQPANKASLCFNLLHQIGSLAQVLLVLSSHGMNLSKIQSLPVVGKEWEYFFHIDLEFEDHAQFVRSLDAISHQVEELHILGEYVRGR